MNVSKNLYDYPPNGAKQEPEICKRCRLRHRRTILLLFEEKSLEAGFRILNCKTGS
jgi:hypothetical protein